MPDYWYVSGDEEHLPVYHEDDVKLTHDLTRMRAELTKLSDEQEVGWPRCEHGYGPGDHHFEAGWCHGYPTRANPEPRTVTSQQVDLVARAVAPTLWDDVWMPRAEGPDFLTGAERREMYRDQQRRLVRGILEALGISVEEV